MTRPVYLILSAASPDLCLCRRLAGELEHAEAELALVGTDVKPSWHASRLHVTHPVRVHACACVSASCMWAHVRVHVRGGLSVSVRART